MHDLLRFRLFTFTTLLLLACLFSNPDKPEPNMVHFEKLDDSQNPLNPALGAALSDSSKISCQ